jgi:hypothetical protein
MRGERRTKHDGYAGKLGRKHAILRLRIQPDHFTQPCTCQTARQRVNKLAKSDGTWLDKPLQAVPSPSIFSSIVSRTMPALGVTTSWRSKPFDGCTFCQVDMNACGASGTPSMNLLTLGSLHKV